MLRAAQRAVGSTRAAALLRRERWQVSPPCALCGGGEARLLHRLPAFSVLACVGCGFARTWPPPQADAAYEDDETYLGAVLAEEARFRRFYRQALQLLLRVGGRGRLLDVGSSVGLLLARAAALLGLGDQLGVVARPTVELETRGG